MIPPVRYPVHPSPSLYYVHGGEPFRPDSDAETVVVRARDLRSVCTSHWKPQFAVIVLTGPGFGLLSDADRDLVWRRWRVPVFEQLADHCGNVIAEECEAHDGLHLCEGSDWFGVVLPGQCPCGLSSPRIPGAEESAEWQAAVESGELVEV